MSGILGGQIALVTGASRGIGRAVAERLARDGAFVVVNYLQNRSAAEATLAAIHAAGGQAELCPFDVARGAAVTEAIDHLVARHGKIDILVNNAGLARDNLLLRLREEEWDQVVDVNLKGLFLCTRAVVRSMIRQRYGRIINMTSVVAHTGNPGQVAYSTAKAGICGFTRTLARELASRSITVNAVAPGFIDTDMTRSLPEPIKTGYLNLIPAGRWGTAEEVAEAVAFLASPLAGYITGQVIHVNGGMYM